MPPLRAAIDGDADAFWPRIRPGRAIARVRRCSRLAPRCARRWRRRCALTLAPAAAQTQAAPPQPQTQAGASDKNLTAQVPKTLPIPMPSLAPLVEHVSSAVVTISAQGGADKLARDQDDDADDDDGDRPGGLPFEDFLRRFFDKRRHARDRTRVCRPRLRVHHRSAGLHRHQQSRRVQGRQDHGHSAGQQPPRGEGRRPGREDRPRPDQDRHEGKTAVRHLGRQRSGQGRRLGRRGRQSVRARRHGDRRHHFGGRAQHQRGAVRRLHPDRRADQPRQFRRPHLRPRRRGDRGQHRDLLAVGRLGRDRLRGSLERREERRPAAQG